MVQREVKEKIAAIVCFGPATATTGMRSGEFFQVTIDPNMVSPLGGYLRFGRHAGDEIQGWQRIDGITVMETLGPSNATIVNSIGYEAKEGASVTLRFVE